MNTKKPYRGEAGPEFTYEVVVNGRKLRKGMQASLIRGVGYPAGRYEFRYGEVGKTGELMLQFYGPVRRTRQKFRLVTPAAVKTVHTRSRTTTETEKEDNE